MLTISMSMIFSILRVFAKLCCFKYATCLTLSVTVSLNREWHEAIWSLFFWWTVEYLPNWCLVWSELNWAHEWISQQNLTSQKCVVNFHQKCYFVSGDYTSDTVVSLNNLAERRTSFLRVALSREVMEWHRIHAFWQHLQTLQQAQTVLEGMSVPSCDHGADKLV